MWERKEGTPRAHNVFSEWEECLDDSMRKTTRSLRTHFSIGFCAPYLFQDGFPHRRLVGKAAQEELSQLDREVGKEGEVSYNI